MPRQNERVASGWPNATRSRALSPTGWALWILGALALTIAVGPARSRQAPGHQAQVSPPVQNMPGAVFSTATATQQPASSSGSWVPSESTWGEQLRNPAFWVGRNGGANWSTPRTGLTRGTPDRSSLPWGVRDYNRLQQDADGDGRTYRTMCVRLCDGYYWPVTYATTKDKFKNDAAACEQSCGGASAAKLFTYRNPGGEIEEMEDLEGNSYKKLSNAFLFRTKYEPSCKCRAHPWEEASTDRHKTYALASEAQNGNRAAAVELKQLRTKLQEEARAAAKSKASQSNLKGAKAAVLEGPAAAVNLKPRVVRGAETRSGHFRSASAAAIESDDTGELPAAEKSSSVRLRLGSRQVLDVPVPRSGRHQKAADAAERRTLKQ